MNPTIASASEKAFRQIYRDIKQHGKEVPSRPDGLSDLTLEVESYTYVLPPRVRFANFAARKLNLNYIRHEMLWYLRGDRFDNSILEHAAIWKNLVRADGSINSNYGQYIFGSGDRSCMQFDLALDELLANKFSRRAAMMILSSGQLADRFSKDYPCTYCISFRIREDQLNMHVHMRSQDAIFGMGNDAPAFSFIHEMMWAALTEVYTDLQLGTYTHTADSLHVYAKHFEMLDKLAADDPYFWVECPEISGPEEVKWLRSKIHLCYDAGKRVPLDGALVQSVEKNPELKQFYLDTNAKFPFSSWLTNFDPPKEK